MKIDECTPEDVHTVGGGEFPPCVGLTSCALPEAQSNVDINAFRYKNYTKYINPRLGTRHQDKTFPNTKGKIVFWDFIII